MYSYCVEDGENRLGKKRILVVEDDGAIRRGVVDALRYEGYDTLEAKNGDNGLDLALKSDCDLVLLDLVLPGMSGMNVLTEIRRFRQTLPVIVLTAKGQEADRVKGLQTGADDYIVKPFSVKELLARVKAVLRRSPERQTDVKEICIPGGKVNLPTCEVCFDDGRRKTLSEKEAALLAYLAANRGRPISRDEILERVWRISPDRIETRTIDMHVARLREKLCDDRNSHDVILTVRGKGYVFLEGTAS